MMKKILFLIPFLMLAWCSEAPVQEQAIEEKPVVEKQIIDVDMLSDEATFSAGDVQYSPIYMQETQQLKSSNEFIPDLDAGSFAKYLVVWYLYVNNWTDEVLIDMLNAPKIYDSQWRWYSVETDASYSVYIKSAMETTRLRPWIPTPLSVAYLVAKDSTWFYIKADDEDWNEHRIHIRDNSADVQ